MNLQPMDRIPPHRAIVANLASLTCFCGLPEEHAIHANSPDTSPQHNGAMVALMLNPEAAAALAVEGGEPVGDLHITLAFLGMASDLSLDQQQLVKEIAQKVAGTSEPLTGIISGAGFFDTPNGIVTWALPEVPGITPLQQNLVGQLATAGILVSRASNFIPHITLNYGTVDQGDIEIGVPLTFDAITVAIAGERTNYAFQKAPEVLGAGDTTPHKYEHPIAPEALPEFTGGLPTSINPPCGICGEPEDAPIHQTSSVTTTPREPVPTDDPATSSFQTAFVSNIDGKTILTTRAESLSSNKYMRHINARMVGADSPNRNNHFWSSQDLQLGKLSVPYTPLNWLHENRHIIGSINRADFIDTSAQQADDLPNAGAVPNHIAIGAGVWSWIYPDESFVIEQASDQQTLYVSMECVSDTVECMEPGCGNTYDYNDVFGPQKQASKICAHMEGYSTVKRFPNPTFLGAAIIVPPVRPGWGLADAKMLSKVEHMAAKSFDLLKPDLTAEQWTGLMGEVVRAFAV